MNSRLQAIGVVITLLAVALLITTSDVELFSLAALNGLLQIGTGDATQGLFYLHNLVSP